MITNHTQKVHLARNCEIASGFFGKMKGLMFSAPKPSTGFVMWFNSMSIRGIHTCFVKEPIDVIYLDETWKVVEIVKRLEPYSFHQPTQKSQFIVLKDLHR